HRLRLEQLASHAADEYGIEPDVLLTDYGPGTLILVPSDSPLAAAARKRGTLVTAPADAAPAPSDGAPAFPDGTPALWNNSGMSGAGAPDIPEISASETPDELGSDAPESPAEPDSLS